MAETELERAEKRFAQARARLQALRNREATKQRKLDTRRKVILGGALVDLAGRDDRAANMLERLVRNLIREQDRAAFDGWDWRVEARSGQADGAGDDEAGHARADGAEISPDVEADAPERTDLGECDEGEARAPEAAGAAQDLEAEGTPTRRLVIPSNPNFHKEFLASRRAGVSED